MKVFPKYINNLFWIIVLLVIFPNHSDGVEPYWDVAQLEQYNIGGVLLESFNLFTLYVNSSDNSAEIYNYIDKWFPENLDGKLLVVFDKVYKGDSVYVLTHGQDNRIVMSGLFSAVSYDFMNEIPAIKQTGKVVVNYAPEYMLDSLDSPRYMVPPQFLGSEINTCCFLNDVIPPGHPLSKWDKNYNSSRNTDFAWELPIIVDIGRLYGLSDEQIKILIAIRIHENGPQGFEFGVKKARDTNLVEQAHWAAGTIRNKARDYLKINSPSLSFIAYLGTQYAPTDPTVGPTERALNLNWIPGVIAIVKYLEPYSIEDILNYPH